MRSYGEKAHELLLAMIDEFLKEHRDGESDFAPVTDEDMQQLHNIMHFILKLKFEPDCDGDLPIVYHLINRHRSVPLFAAAVVREPRHERGRQLANIISHCTSMMSGCFESDEPTLENVDVDYLEKYRSTPNVNQNPDRVTVTLSFAYKENAKLYRYLYERY